MGTFKEWDTKFQNRIKMAVIVTSRIFEFNLKRWKEIQGQEQFICGFLESYMKDFVDNQTNQVQFFNSIDPKNKKRQTDIYISRNSDIPSFNAIQEELFQSLQIRNGMKKNIVTEFNEKVIQFTKQELKEMTVNVPKDTDIDLEKGRIIVDTSQVQAGDTPTYGTAKSYMIPQGSSVRTTSLTSSDLTQKSLNQSQSQAQDQTRRASYYTSVQKNHESDVLPNHPKDESLVHKYPQFKKYIENLKKQSLMKLLTMCKEKKADLIEKLKSTDELRDAFIKKVKTSFKNNQEDKKLAEKDVYKSLLDYSRHIRSVKFKIYEFSETVCYAFRRMELREIKGHDKLTGMLNIWYEKYVTAIGNKAEQDGFAVVMDAVKQVINYLFYLEIF